MRFRLLLLTPFTLLACCTPSKPPAPAPSATPSTAATPAPSPAALAAVSVAQDYFDKLTAKKWKEAHALWMPAVVGPLPAFAAVSAKATGFTGKAGAPSAIKPTDGTDYAVVDAVTTTADTAHGTVRRDGVVMLKRPTGSEQPWRIWGTDIRVRHCKPGEQPRGLGCIPA